MSKCITVFMALFLFLTSCVSSTLIQSEPSGAKLYLNGDPVGTTPYRYQDTKLVGTCTTVNLEKDGYEPFSTSFCRDEEVDVGAVVGGVFFLFPFIWIMKYKPLHTYQLYPAGGMYEPQFEVSPKPTQIVVKSKADRLRELKQLLDEGVLTQQEYDSEKGKILEEDER